VNVFVNLSIMKPNQGHEQDTIDSMHRFGEAARAQSGLQLVTTLREPESGDLYGIAVWETEEAARAASGALMAAVANDDFETWVAEMQNFRLEEV
jgi:heme-degrading monooxygenase HmoA